MFDFTNLDSIKKNPIVSREFVKHLSAYELLLLVKEAKGKSESILNQESIINGILESEDDAKILILASGSKLDGFAKSDNFLKIYNKGDAFKSALFCNYEFDWYSLFIWNHTILDEILNDVLKEDSKLSIPFYNNPRMDRRVISGIIKAKEFDKSKHKFDFSKITFQQRYEAVTIALEVKEIKSEDYYGKDSPDNNEIFFSKPNGAIAVFVKDLIENWNVEGKFSKSFATNLVHYIDVSDAELDNSDFISQEEDDKIDKEESDFNKKWDAKSILAFSNLIRFFDQSTKSVLPTEIKDSEKDLFSDYSNVLLILTLIPKLLKDYKYRNDVNYFLSNLIGSDNWVIRASGYSFIFQNLKIEEDDVSLLSKFIEKFKKDKLALIWSIYGSSHFELITRINRPAYDLFNQLFISANFNDEMLKYFSDISEFIFGYKYRDMDYEDMEKLLQKNNKELKKYSVEYYLNSSNFSSNISNNNPNDSFSFQLGKAVGKIFRN